MLAARRQHHPPIAIAILTLEPLHILNRVRRRHHRILPGRLLPPAPPRVPENIDIGRPERQPGLARIVHGPGLDGDGPCEGPPEGAVEGGGGDDDLGEAGGGGDGAGCEVDAGAVGGDAVEGLGPPLVAGEAEAGDGGGVVGELGDLFREGEVGDEGVGPGWDGEGGVAEGVGVVVWGLAGIVVVITRCYYKWEDDQEEE